jgi:hypothetical protein
MASANPKWWPILVGVFQVTRHRNHDANAYQIGKELGYTREETEDQVAYLVARGLIEHRLTGTEHHLMVGVTDEGIVLVMENIGDPEPERPPVGFRA